MVNIMSELARHRGEVDEQTRREYSYSAFQLMARRNIHLKYADPPIGEIKNNNYGIEGEMMVLLGQKNPDKPEQIVLDENDPNQVLVDIACGEGQFLRNLREVGYKGRLFGINYPGEIINPDVAKYGISFMEGDARKLPIRSGSADIVTANFCFYHMDNWQEAMREIFRILKPGGRLLVATREEDHQEELWRFSKIVAEDIKNKVDHGIIQPGSLIGDPNRKISPRRVRVVPPENYYPHFDFENLKAFRELFEYEFSYRQISENHWPFEDWLEYSFGVLSLWESFKVVIKGKRRKDKQAPDEEHYMEYSNLEVLKSIDQRIRPIYRSEIETRRMNKIRQVVMEKLNNGEELSEEDIDSIKGFFTEYIRQGFDIFTKPLEKERQISGLAEHVGRAAIL